MYRHWCVRVSIFTMMALGQTVSAQPLADRMPNADHARSLNSELLSLYDQYRTASPARQLALRTEVATLAAKRADLIETLVRKDPDTALRFAFSQDLLAGLAQDFPESARLFESRGAWQGQADIWVQDAADMKSSKTTIKLNTSGERLDVVFGGGPPKNLQCGSILTVNGVRKGSAIAVESAKVTAATSSPCSTTGTQHIAVLLVTFPGVTPAVTPSAVYNMMFGSGNRSLNGYWQEASYGKTSASGNVFGWYTLPTAYTCDEYESIQAAAITAAANDVNFLNYNRIFIVFPLPSGCYWAGLGNIGCSYVFTPQGTYSASVSWLIADYLTPNDSGVALAAHEGGHNLGLWHSESRGFGSTTPLGAIGTSGIIQQYGDPFSVMSAYNLGHYAAQQKYQLGWLTSSNVETVESSGSYLVKPYESGSTGVQALQIQRGSGNNDWLWLEYRQPIGNYDTTLSSSQIFSGAMVHYFDSLTGSYTNLLNFTPADSSWENPVLGAGRSWSDPYTNVSLAVQSATSSGLTVGVNYVAPACTPANPSVTVSPANPTVSAGSSAGYTLTITNNDSAGCSPSPFGVSTTQPSGWAASLSSGSVTLSPGSTVNETLIETPPSGTPAGTYAVTATASRSPQSGTGDANCSVVTVAAAAQISVTLSMNAATFASNATISSTAQVLSGASPLSGAKVTFTLTKSNGSTASATANTNPTGQAAWNYKLAPKDPAGTYTVKATVTSGSQTATSAVTTFYVQ